MQIYVTKDHEGAEKQTRYIAVDFARGLTVAFVVVFHFIWDMEYFGLLSFDTDESAHAWVVRSATLQFLSYCFVMYSCLHIVAHIAPIIAEALAFPVIFTCIALWKTTAQEYGVAMIMFILGMSLAIRNASGVPGYNRVICLSAVACFISLASYVCAPGQFIYFGAIHCLTLNSLLGIGLLPFARYCGLFGSLILLYTTVFGRFPLEVPVYPSLDFMPWFNNMAWVSFGIYAHHLGFHRIQSDVFGKTIFPTLGRNSLRIYLCHQLILFPLVYGVKRLS